MNVIEQQILDRYRELAVQWAGLRVDPKKANRVFERHHAYYEEIRNVPEGRRVLRGRVTTVIQGSRVNANYINNLKEARP